MIVSVIYEPSMQSQRRCKILKLWFISMKIKEQRNDNLVKHWTFCGWSVCVDVIILLIRISKHGRRNVSWFRNKRDYGLKSKLFLVKKTWFSYANIVTCFLAFTPKRNKKNFVTCYWPRKHSKICFSTRKKNSQHEFLNKLKATILKQR